MKRKKISTLLVLAVAFLLVVMSFDTLSNLEIAGEEAVVAEQVQSLVNQHIAARQATCDKQLLVLATAKVDSILMFHGQRYISDLDTSMLSRPTAPSKPPIQSLGDSSPIKPIIENIDTTFGE